MDTPDPDNFSIVLHILKSFPKERVAVVLNIRVLDLSVTRYDHEFGKVRHYFEMLDMALPLEKDLALREELQDFKHFFRRDAGVENGEVRKDTSIYMLLSSLRLAAFLEERFNFPPEVRHVSSGNKRKLSPATSTNELEIIYAPSVPRG